MSKDTYYNDAKEEYDPDMILILAGIVPEQMEYLSYQDRVHILKSAGLDPDQYDF